VNKASSGRVPFTESKLNAMQLKEPSEEAGGVNRLQQWRQRNRGDSGGAGLLTCKITTDMETVASSGLEED
jgi:hypothetical protein